MQIPTLPQSLQRYQDGHTSRQGLEQLKPFVRQIADELRAGHNESNTELSLLRISSRLKNEVIEHTTDFDVTKGSFRNSETALNIALAAAAAGVIDAVIYWQTQDAPLLVSVPQPSSSEIDSRLVNEVKRTMDQSAANMVDLSQGQASDSQFAENRIPRSREELMEELDWGTAGPGGFFQLGYRLGALSGLSAAQV